MKYAKISTGTYAIPDDPDLEKELKIRGITIIEDEEVIEDGQ